MDSPLAVNATEVFKLHPECYDNEMHEYLRKEGDPFGFNSLHYVSELEQSKELNEMDSPAIIISASGMAQAGRVKHHIFHRAIWPVVSTQDDKNASLLHPEQSAQ